MGAKMDDVIHARLERMADAQSDKDDLMAIYFWEKLLGFDGLPDDARRFAEEVAQLYRNRLAVGGGSTSDDEDDGELSPFV